ncbi:hypothetical protein DFH08DRAFT_827424 [Mycena albidolilacea]|uniref:Uncharacterized protein n=1 Tax=Mycena albidolilacea TaxID=1033008 RepID=A0AAD6YY85_9AGAR|nr:hypothetical protein DFH08DRAFT_827424 [Mycena albidolilacea]
MLFCPISFALLALSLVHASPNPLPANGILPSTIDVTRRAPVAVKITSVASLNPVVTFSGTPPLEVLVGQAAAPPGNFGIWERSEVSADKYVFQNLGTGQWITVNEANVLHSSIPRTRVNATLFAVESAGEGEFEIKLPNADSVWEALFDGTSPIFGRVTFGTISDYTAPGERKRAPALDICVG